jgi:hypothetical protein
MIRQDKELLAAVSYENKIETHGCKSGLHTGRPIGGNTLRCDDTNTKKEEYNRAKQLMEIKVKRKGKVHTRTGHEGPGGRRRMTLLFL